MARRNPRHFFVYNCVVLWKNELGLAASTMNATLTPPRRPPLHDSATELQLLFDQHVAPFFNKLSNDGLLITNPAPHIAAAALRELGEVYAGPKTVHFGRLEDGAKFSLHDEKYVKLNQSQALHCMSGQTRGFNGSSDVVYDATEDCA